MWLVWLVVLAQGFIGGSEDDSQICSHLQAWLDLGNLLQGWLSMMDNELVLAVGGRPQCLITWTFPEGFLSILMTWQLHFHSVWSKQVKTEGGVSLLSGLVTLYHLLKVYWLHDSTLHCGRESYKGTNTRELESLRSCCLQAGRY